MSEPLWSKDEWRAEAFRQQAEVERLRKERDAYRTLLDEVRFHDWTPIRVVGLIERGLAASGEPA